MDALEMIKLGIATGVAALTITRARPLRGIRRWVKSRSDWWGELVQCPYCMSHWIAAGLVLWNWPGTARVAVLEWMVAVAIAAPIATAVYLCIRIIQPPQPEPLYSNQQQQSDVGSPAGASEEVKEYV